jgi:hypothetical protein
VQNDSSSENKELSIVNCQLSIINKKLLQGVQGGGFLEKSPLAAGGMKLIRRKRINETWRKEVPSHFSTGKDR